MKRAKYQYLKAISFHDSFNDPLNKMLGKEGCEWTEELALKLLNGRIVDAMDVAFIHELEEGNGNLPTENASRANDQKHIYFGHTKEEIDGFIQSRDSSCQHVTLLEMEENEWNSLEIIRQREIEDAKFWNSDLFDEELSMSLQDFKRFEADQNFGTPQDVTEAKKRVINHLKERHPNMTEETIKTNAKIKHSKGSMSMSKRIGKGIAD